MKTQFLIGFYFFFYHIILKLKALNKKIKNEGL